MYRPIRACPGDSRELCSSYGLSSIIEFERQNSIPKLSGGIKLGPTRIGGYGLYEWTGHTAKITVDVDSCRRPVATPVRSWSYPGWKSDVTPAGVICHEYGHHVYYSLGLHKSRAIAGAIRNIRSLENKITSYEPNSSEMFAELLRVWILNPDLVARGWPLRAKLLSTIGLRPIHGEQWDSILVYAHKRFHEVGRKIILAPLSKDGTLPPWQSIT